MKKIGISILILLLTVAFTGCSFQDSSVAEKDNTTTINDTVDGVLYNLKINPEFEIKASEDLVVTEIMAKNEDAESVLSAVNVLGLNVDEAFATLTNEAKNQGFMTQENGNTVNITILEKDDEKLPTCPVCEGCGTVVCKDCHGTGIACMCDWCKGEGIKLEFSPDCWLCHGTGICPECGGSGEIVVTNGEDGGIVYVEPGVPEMGLCSVCWGTGGCDNCHGNYNNSDGDQTCQGCNGTGYLHCNDDLNGYSWCPCCWGSGIEGTGDPDYESYYTPSDKYEIEEWKAILKN